VALITPWFLFPPSSELLFEASFPEKPSESNTTTKINVIVIITALLITNI
jgi:hypothetical protein